MQEIDVYHGSPHRFEEFDASKIGTGEGAQAYGHGIYLAENPDVAKSYRFKRLTGDIAFDDGTKINVLNLPKGSPEKVAAQIWLLSPSYKEASTYVLGRDRKQWQKEHPEWENAQEQVLNEIKKLDQKGAKLGGGSVYTADLPDEMVERMLDWDKPLSQQSPAVQKAVKQLMDSEMWDADTRKLIGDADIKGSKFYEAVASLDELAGRGPFGQAASEELARLGIPGIKYADAGSRGQGGSGTRNFVVFPGEEKKVKILKRE
jgi:dihydrofolate reductase